MLRVTHDPEGLTDQFNDLLRETVGASAAKDVSPLPGEFERLFRQPLPRAPEAARPGAGPKPAAPPSAVAARRKAVKVGRNDPCPCGSGKKYKRCCGA